MGPSSGRGGREAKNWWSYKEFEVQSVNKHIVKGENKKV
jgi:hypothetical protein